MGMLGVGPFATPHGGFAPSLAVDVTRLYPIHPKLSDEEAELGATAVINPNDEDVEERVKEECGPLGADVVFECAGIPTTIDQSVTLARRGGVVSLVGLAALPAQIAPGNWLVKEVRLVASLGYLHEEFDHTMQLVSDGRLLLAPLHTSTVGLADLDGAFRSLLANEGDVKILVDPRL
jgi:threonine dehydrogenase-like Zn-dependent dehydrogenase